MIQALRTLVFAGACVGFALIGTACSAGYGETCTLPDAQQIDLACEPISGGSFCVYDRAHDCDSSICAKEVVNCEGNNCPDTGRVNAFCTFRCEADEECPDKSRCEPINAGTTQGVCVPDRVVN